MTCPVAKTKEEGPIHLLRTRAMAVKSSPRVAPVRGAAKALGAPHLLRHTCDHESAMPT